MATAEGAFPDTSAYAAWIAAARKVLKEADPIGALTRPSEDGIAIAPLYPPGTAAPVMRGAPEIQVFQRVDDPDLARAAVQARDDLQNGAGGLTLVLAGAPAAHGLGLEIATRDDLDSLLVGSVRDRDAPTCRIRCEVGGFALPVVWSFLAERAEALGLHVADHGFDPIGVMARSGAAPEPIDDVLGEAADYAKRLTAAGALSPVFRADGRPHHEAGASDGLELAAVLAAGVTYLRALERVGLDLDQARRAISVTLAAGPDFVLTIAKVRALRRLWAHVEDRCGLAARPIALHVETSWRMLTRKDPWTNLLRGTVACAAALIGGADTVTMLPHTFALGLPDAFARRLARNAPLILMEEAGLGRAADPSAGAGALDAVTEGLCRRAWERFQAVEAIGGMAPALRDGTWQGWVADVRHRRDADVAAGRRTIVGTTAFVDQGEAPLPALAGEPQENRLADQDRACPPLLPVRDAAGFETVEVGP